MSADSSAIPTSLRLYGLEGSVATLDGAVTRQRESLTAHSQAIGQQAVTLAKHDEQIIDVKKDVAGLTATVDKVIWLVVGFAFTVAASAIGTALTVILTQ